ncbi:MAG: hypothetical protein HFG39_08405 [Lachnospiraceae bacterium]|nr:hypothetical protein [Lachnospiraceae bacterium]
MKTILTVVLVILVILVVLLGILAYFGRKAQKKQAEQKATMDAMAQTMSLYIIDKKRMKLTEANLPKVVLDSTPKYMRWMKMPMVKAKAGPRVMTLICDEPVFAQILPKQEVKATISGIYITSAKRIRGPLPEPKNKKKGFFSRFKKKG